MKFIEINYLVEKNELEFLYHLLKSRTHSISHKKLPSFKEHTNFVKNHPYHKWFFVEKESQRLGSLYIHQDNSIGLDILEKFEEHIPEILSFLEKEYKPLPQIKSVRSKNFFINVSPESKSLHTKLLLSGYKISQISFEKS